MSKSSPRKLNLQIRSASFKENGHAGTGTQNKTSVSMQLLKSQWKSQTSNVDSSPKLNTTLSSNPKKSGSDIVDSKSDLGFTDSANGKKNDTDQVLVLGKTSLEKRLSGNKNSNVDSQFMIDGIVRNEVANSEKSKDNKTRTKGSEMKALQADERLVTSTKSDSEMKAETRNTSVVLAGRHSVGLTTDSVIQSAKPAESGKNMNNSATSNIHEESMKEIGVNDTKADKENVSRIESRPVINNISPKADENLEQTRIALCDYTTDSSISKGSNEKVGQLSTVLSELTSHQNNVENNQEVKLGVNLTPDSKTETEEKLSRNSSASRISLPDKRKLSDDPETVIEELQEYLRQRFGSVVSETYSQVGQIETECENKSVGEPDPVVCLNFTSEADSDRTSEKSEVTTPTSATVDKKSETFIPHPIFFKTSIKKDPGSKLHDALVNELSSVLRKRDDTNDTGTAKESVNKEETESGSDKSKFPRRRISAKGNKVLGNKALLATLEDHLTRTLHKNKIFQRQSLKVLGLETIEIKQETKSGEPNQEINVSKEPQGNIPIAPPLPHYGAVPLHISPKHVENTKKFTDKSVEVHKEVLEKSEQKVTVDKDISKVLEKSEQKVTVDKDTSKGSVVNKEIQTKTTKEKGSELNKDDQLLIYTYEHPSGRTEGVVCSVETSENPDNLGKASKYITCVNIVAEKSGIYFG